VHRAEVDKNFDCGDDIAGTWVGGVGKHACL
jgi:hypothetical protein